MTEPLEIVGDSNLVCTDGVCAVPEPQSVLEDTESSEPMVQPADDDDTPKLTAHLEATDATDGQQHA